MQLAWPYILRIYPYYWNLFLSPSLFLQVHRILRIHLWLKRLLWLLVVSYIWYLCCEWGQKVKVKNKLKWKQRNYWQDRVTSSRSTALEPGSYLRKLVACLYKKEIKTEEKGKWSKTSSQIWSTRVIPNPRFADKKITKPNSFIIKSCIEISWWRNMLKIRPFPKKQQSSEVRFWFHSKKINWQILVSRVTKCWIHGRTLTICSSNQRLKRSCAIKNRTPGGRNWL